MAGFFLKNLVAFPPTKPRFFESGQGPAVFREVYLGSAGGSRSIPRFSQSAVSSMVSVFPFCVNNVVPSLLP